eukprot:sb/3469128/
MMVTDKPVPMSPCGQFIKTSHELGKGNQRVVYRGVDVRTGRCVAWCEPKKLNSPYIPSQFKKEKDFISFIRSSILLETVHHKNIVAFLEMWEPSPSGSRTPILITELMSCSLTQHFKGSPRGFDHAVIQYWARQVLEAIKYLHFNGSHVIVHRSGDVKLSSFCTAVVKHPGKELDELVEPPEFMSPEMVREKYDQRTDVYSYGLTLLEMITQVSGHTQTNKQTNRQRNKQQTNKHHSA